MTDTGQIFFHLTNLHTVYFWLQRQWYQNPIMCIFISSFAKLNSLTSYFAFKPRPSNFVLWNQHTYKSMSVQKVSNLFNTSNSLDLKHEKKILENNQTTNIFFRLHPKLLAYCSVRNFGYKSRKKCQVFLRILEIWLMISQL